MATDSTLVADRLPNVAADSARAAGVPADKPAQPPRIIIEPPVAWRAINVRELWQFRELLYFLVWRDVKVRYKQTLLGAAWAVLQPAMMMVVFTIFFARMAKLPAGDWPYPLFVYAGLLPWTFFSTSLAQAAQSVVGSERLITKIYFPRLAIPLAAVGAALVDFVIALGLLAVLMLWYGAWPTRTIALVPAIMACFFLAAAGVGTLLAALNVAYRDFRYVVPFLIQLWMFATPTIYMDPAANGRGKFDSLLLLNPLSPLVGSFRSAILGGPIAWQPLAIAAAASAALFLAGCYYFRHVEDTFSDVI
jgi:lipopolysaccharide transport system permease protein